MVKEIIVGSAIPASAVGTVTEVKAENLAESLGMQQLVYKNSDGKTLPYCQVAEGENLPGNYSLVLFFHGAGERGFNNFSQLVHGIPQLLDYIRQHKLKVVVIAPQCPPDKQWVDTPWDAKSHTMPVKPSEPMALAMNLLDSKTKEFQVNPDRIYVTGISMGGYGTWDLISRRPDFFAAAIPVCGGADLACADKLKNLPLNVFHGDSDSVVPPVRSRNMVKALKDAGSKKVTYHELYRCDHNSWTPAYNDSFTWQWLFDQKKSVSGK